VGGNQSTRRKLTTFGGVLIDSFHIESVARIEPTISEVKGASSDACAIKARILLALFKERNLDKNEDALDKYDFPPPIILRNSPNPPNTNACIYDFNS
jgi:hypothetical protein